MASRSSPALVVCLAPWRPAPALLHALHRVYGANKRSDDNQCIRLSNNGTGLVLLFRNMVPYLRTPHPAFGHPLPQGERAVIIKKTALSLWERANRAAVGESIEATTTRHRNCERQYLVIGTRDSGTRA